MAPTTVSIVVAVISLLGVISVELSRRRAAARLQEEGKRRDAELEELKSRLTAQREAETRQEQAAELLTTYRLPVARAAYDLQSRIYNIHRGFAGGGDAEYFRLNTLFLIAEFFGWLEIVRQEIQFLDPVTDEGGLGLQHRLDRVRDLFAETSHRRVGADPLFIYRGEQRAIGELMIVETRSRCRGYASFVAEMERPEFARWFERIGGEIENLDGRSARLEAIQHALIDVLDELDPGRTRFPEDRSRIGQERGGQSTP